MEVGVCVGVAVAPFGVPAVRNGGGFVLRCRCRRRGRVRRLGACDSAVSERSVIEGLEGVCNDCVRIAYVTIR